MLMAPLSTLRRLQFGQPIANFQGMQFQYAEAAIQIEAARTMMYNAARMKQAGVST
jgi:short/branched chain acyl-CoA dehydrogenase